MMRATAKNRDYQVSEKIALDTADLMQMLSCGRQTALKIGKAADARRQIGRRVLWDAGKVREYIRNMQR